MATNFVTFQPQASGTGNMQLGGALDTNVALLVQNRGPFALYFGDGEGQADNSTYAYLVPPFSQAAFPLSSRKTSWLVDPNGQLGTLSANKQRVTVILTDTMNGSYGITPMAPLVGPGAQKATFTEWGNTGASSMTLNYGFNANEFPASTIWNVAYWHVGGIPENNVMGSFTWRARLFYGTTQVFLRSLTTMCGDGATNYRAGNALDTVFQPPADARPYVTGDGASLWKLTVDILDGPGPAVNYLDFFSTLILVPAPTYN